MPNPFYFRAAMNRFCRLAGDEHPAHIRLAATIKMIRDLMPGTPRARLAVPRT